MTDEMVRTGVDDLLDYLKGKDKVPMHDAAKVLGISADTLQAWVDFLVEEKIIGIEYKFTKPFIYLNKEEEKKRTKIIETTGSSLEEVKEAYFARAHNKQIPKEKAQELWKSHVKEALQEKHDYFMDQAARRHVHDPEQLWQEYQRYLLGRI